MRPGRGGFLRMRTIKEKKGKMRHVDLFFCQLISSLEILCGFMMGCQREQLGEHFLFRPLLRFLIRMCCFSSPLGSEPHQPFDLSPLFNLSPYFLLLSFSSPTPQLLLHHIHFSLSSLFFRLPTQSKVTPDLRLPLTPAAMLNNEAEQREEARLIGGEDFWTIMVTLKVDGV